ncbi:DUF6292 family protein [Actinokineospora cianjurensis]|uniref:DUF6292 domain-containing protein n=1 Tax=Actinokineospora cianjurensis TaxID=585224 RepID=A0A421B3Q2_9PSEU|nr:DUF6292 family protein [Actinokineospora cianjurensis]RLK58997.1 hypothetical protein CLV68_3478 [Actinokineospora cianjurensis]
MTRTDAHPETHRDHRSTQAAVAGAPRPRAATGWRPTRAVSQHALTPPTEIAHALASALGGYVRTVAAALGVPAEGVTCEVTDTVTAYVALGHRATAYPDRDVMLVWDARGWSVSVETDPAERPIVLSAASGDLVPDPAEVAGFVSVALARRTARSAAPAAPDPLDWTDVVERMRGHGR